MSTTKNMVDRKLAAADAFIAYAMEHAALTKQDAGVVLGKYLAAKVLTLNPHTGAFHVKHGAFLDSETLRNAAGVQS